MGFFANGTEGEAYQANICERCINFKEDEYGRTCPVWEIHLDYNSVQDDNNIEVILSILIPRRGIHNDICAMFHPAKPEYADLGERYHAWLESKSK